MNTAGDFREVGKPAGRRSRMYALAVLGLIASIYLIWIEFHGWGILGIAAAIMMLLLNAFPNLLDRAAKPAAQKVTLAERGAAGEQVSAALARMDEDHVIFHSISSPYGKIDHIVLDRHNGLFLLESQPHFGQVQVKDGRLRINGHPPERDFTGRLLRNCFWLREQVKRQTGVLPWITPVLVFPRAQVDAKVDLKGVRVINLQDLVGVVENSERPRKANALLWEKREEIRRIFEML